MPLTYDMGKGKVAKDIASCILTNMTNQSVYAEPFSGMMSVGIKIMKKDKFEKYIFSDFDERVIVFTKALSNGWIPENKTLSIEEWKALRANKNLSAQKSFYGYMLGYNGKYFARTKPFSHDRQEKVFNNKIKYLKSLRPLLSSDKVVVMVKSFNEQNYKNTVIYCDPPYIDSTVRSKAWRKKNWNTKHLELFWKCIYRWLNPELNNIVFVSEMTTFSGERFHDKLKYEIVWEKGMCTTNYDGCEMIRTDRTEYLFRIARNFEK